MSDHTNLDRMLKDWTEARTPAGAHLDKLATSIRNEIVARRYEQGPESTPARIGLLPRLAYATLGSAVTLVLAAFWVLRIPTADNGDAAYLAAISAQRAAVGGKLFAEMERLFAQDFRWVAESNGDVDLGVGVLPGGAGRQSVPALVRLTVVARAEGQKTWRPIWNADVIVRGEDRVEISPNRKADNRLALWVCPLEDGKVAVDSVISLDAPVQVGGRLGAVVSQGVPTEIMTVRSGGTEYRVFQTTTMLRHG
jgi:hypothetical protein